jgi:CHAD domain-containing protein
MRATLRVFRELLPNTPRRHFTGELAWFAGELGRVRDLDVQCTTLERDIAALPAAESARFRTVPRTSARRPRTRRAPVPRNPG